MKFKVGVAAPQFRDHRHERGDADPSGDQQMALGVLSERKVVARHRDLDEIANPQGLVQIPRAAAALLFKQDRDTIPAALGRIVAQGVLPYEIVEPQIDVCTGCEPRQVAAARIDEFVPVDGFGEKSDRTDAQLHN
jgi:hypothetical protein